MNADKLTAVEWLVQHHCTADVMHDFPAPSRRAQIEVLQAMAQRLATVDVPAPFAELWASACTELQDVTRDIGQTLDWGEREGTPQ